MYTANENFLKSGDGPASRRTAPGVSSTAGATLPVEWARALPQVHPHGSGTFYSSKPADRGGRGPVGSTRISAGRPTDIRRCWVESGAVWGIIKPNGPLLLCTMMTVQTVETPRQSCTELHCHAPMTLRLSNAELLPLGNSASPPSNPRIRKRWQGADFGDLPRTGPSIRGSYRRLCKIRHGRSPWRGCTGHHPGDQCSLCPMLMSAFIGWQYGEEGIGGLVRTADAIRRRHPSWGRPHGNPWRRTAVPGGFCWPESRGQYSTEPLRLSDFHRFSPMRAG